MSRKKKPSGRDPLFERGKNRENYQRRWNLLSPKKTILIVCEGKQTEPNYFNALRSTLRRKNIRVLSIGISILVVVFIFFAYTSIGQGNDQIRRMRTAFDPNYASFQVRLDNQKILKGYLASRPFGGGIGHGGVKAQKYLPNAFLSQVATDSWYVLIWVEQGIVGLLIHLFILFYVIGVASFRIMFRIRDPILKMKMAALASGMFGVMVASYGNAVLGGMPTGMLIYTSMALLMNTEVLDKPAEEFTQNLVAA